MSDPREEWQVQDERPDRDYDLASCYRRPRFIFLNWSQP